jgi:hypothetical protein
MKNHKYIFTFIFTLFISLSLFSQHRNSRKKIKTLKISYITEKLNLSESEAAKFWPIYNKFEKKKYELYHLKRNDLKKEIDKLGGIENLTEKQAKSVSSKMLAMKRLLYDGYVKFQSDLSKIITYKQIVLLEVGERDFERRLMKRFRSQKVRKIKKENK